ncbi:Ssm4 ring finger fused to a forkhead associated (FHA) domain [Cryptosporidium sp. chipmunk genotype I]|uniref:Ssm4 ring finger fused to a forkhead associated (FHA) domain n=1 Tax=Cryptosporidium sp. chipmunk genotype I TaxID=1280935 RepID=UPI00351A100B|nr:Ssm4 ring finger fused to a forkhead associated (FHA) domain [Cryptosporidium sp. chipmunk genotype I]
MRFSSKGSGISVLIESTTSSGESHGLYDYEKKTKFNQTLSIDDTQCSYIIFIENETGQLVVQPELDDNLKLSSNFGQESGHNVKYGTNRTVISNIQDFGKEFVPILRLYLFKSSWFVEVIKDINRKLKASGVYYSQSSSVSGYSADFCFRSLPKSSSSRGRNQHKEDNKVWLVAPKSSPGIPLIKGDLLKFGRCKMLIHDIINTSSMAREESSKAPFLPLMGHQDFQTSFESFLEVAPLAEADKEPKILSCSTNHILEKVLGGYSKNNFKLVSDLQGNSLVECEDDASKFINSSSVSNNATSEDLNSQMLHNQDYQVLQIENSDSSVLNPGIEAHVQNKFDQVINCEQKSKVNRCCRICLSDDGEGFIDTNEPLNPLICPCDCKGSMQYVHLQCLRTWLESRLDIPSEWFLHTGRDYNTIESLLGNSIQVQDEAENSSQLHFRDRVRFKVINIFKKWTSRFSGSNCRVNSPACLHLRKFECELCKVYFPTQLRIIDNYGCGLTFIPLFRVPRPKFPYLVLVPLEGDFSSKIGQIVVSFGGTSTSVCIGRGHNSDIRLGEISVSRSHAQFQHCYYAGSYQICLLDMKSKFGSLVEFTRPIKLGKENLSVQIGKTLVSFKTFKSNGSTSNILPFFSGCIGRRMTISDSQELKIKSQKTSKSFNLTFDSSSELSYRDSELINSLRNVSNITNNDLGDCDNLEGDIKQLHSFRNVSNYRIPQRHSYIFEP